MKTRSKKECAEIEHKFGGNFAINERQTEAEYSLDPFSCPSEFEELDTTIKVENYTDRDRDLVADIVKSELVEFYSNQTYQTEDIFLQKDMKTILFEKIQKTETEIFGDNDEPFSSSYEVDDPFKHDTFSDSDLNLDPDPERDPFADVDCDPSFSQHPPSNSSNGSAATKVELTNATGVNDSSNPSSSTKSILEKTRCTSKSKSDRKRKALNSELHCQLCLGSRHSETWLKTHLETCAASHKDRHRFCFPCNRLFFTIGAYRQHSIRIHNFEGAEFKECLQIFKCQFCPCSFALKDELVAHLASHPEVNTIDKEDLKQWPYRCQKCPFTFKHHNVYTLHMLSHKNEELFKCPEPNCGKEFKYQSKLKTHLGIRHSEDRPFKCSESNCGKTFKTNGELKMHVVCHSEERPFKCLHYDCCKTFKRKDRLKEHLALHTEARRLKQMTTKTFKCSQPGCFAGYTRAYSLKLHITQKHKR